MMILTMTITIPGFFKLVTHFISIWLDNSCNTNTGLAYVKDWKENDTHTRLSQTASCEPLIMDFGCLP